MPQPCNTAPATDAATLLSLRAAEAALRSDPRILWKIADGDGPALPVRPDHRGRTVEPTEPTTEADEVVAEQPGFDGYPSTYRAVIHQLKGFFIKPAPALRPGSATA